MLRLCSAQAQDDILYIAIFTPRRTDTDQVDFDI